MSLLDRAREFPVRGLAPSRADYATLPRTWRGDLLAGLTVGVVALPLALGFGVASGVGATAGLVTAIVAGIVAAVFGGSPVQVSGPTGAMAVVLVPIVATQGASAVATVAVMAGVIVLIAGVLGLGRVIQFVPWPVLEGFTVGIAVTIALQQVPLVLGLAKGSGTSVLDSAWRAVNDAGGSTLWQSGVLAAGVVVVMVVWPKLHSRLPGSIVAVVVVSVTSVVTHFRVVTIGALPNVLVSPHLPALGPTVLRHLFGPALAVAALAAIESLLSARVADTMTGWAHSDENREMVGQGLANIACGLFGGMPATGAIARTAVNVKSGGRSRLAAVTHSVVIASVVLFAAPLVTRIPLAVLGGVLVVTAVKMVDRVRVGSIVRSHFSETAIFALTALVTVMVDLVTAIEVGLLVAGVSALRAIAKSSGVTREALGEHHEASEEEMTLLEEHIALYRLDGALFFAAAPRFTDALAQVRGVRVVILRLKGLSFIDASGADVLARIVEDLESRGVIVLVKGASAQHSTILRSASIFEDLEKRHHLFTELPAAISHARQHVGVGDSHLHWGEN